MRKSALLSIIAIEQCCSKCNKLECVLIWNLVCNKSQYVVHFWNYIGDLAKCALHTLHLSGRYTRPQLVREWNYNTLRDHSRNMPLAVYGQAQHCVHQHCSCSWTLFLVIIILIITHFLGCLGPWCLHHLFQELFHLNNRICCICGIRSACKVFKVGSGVCCVTS